MLSALLVLSGAWQASAPTSATCRSVGLDPARTWQFTSTDGRWQVAHWPGEATREAVRLALPPRTEVRLTRDEVVVRGRTSNGGIDVRLEGPAQKATLDVYVSYELEVNVDTSLTPRIDELNTEGPVAVRCEFPQP